MTLLVEGRVGVMVPAQWIVQRVTTGPGSARLQVVSPADDDIAVHVTQSSLPAHWSHAQVAASLGSALEEEPDGVFVEFNPSDRRADQPAVTYREIRADHHIAWVVLTDGTLRIAIGCQSAPGREAAVRRGVRRSDQVRARGVLKNIAAADGTESVGLASNFISRTDNTEGSR